MISKKQIVPKAVYWGLGTFAVLYLGFIFLGNLTNAEPLAVLFWLQVFLLVISGFVAGTVAKHHGWANGAMVGVAAPFVLAIGTAIATMEPALAPEVLAGAGIFWLIQSVLLCSLGGFIYDAFIKVK